VSVNVGGGGGGVGVAAGVGGGVWTATGPPVLAAAPGSRNDFPHEGHDTTCPASDGSAASG
jgi:hypothetical protein